MSSPIRRALLCLAIVLPSFATWPLAAHADDWPSFRHDAMFYAAIEETVKPPLAPIWSYESAHIGDAKLEVDDGNAMTPYRNRFELDITSAGDSVFVTSEIGGRIFCLDAASGKLRWEFLAGAAVNRPATYADGRIYTGSDDGIFYCLDAKTGAELWRYKAIPDDRWFFHYGQWSSIWPVRTNALVHRGVVYFAAGVYPHEGRHVLALDAKTGKKLWAEDTRNEQAFRWDTAPTGNIYRTLGGFFVPLDTKGFLFGFFTSYPLLHPDKEGIDRRFILHRVDAPALHCAELVKDKKVVAKTGTFTVEGYKTLDTKLVYGMPIQRGAKLLYNPDISPFAITGGVSWAIGHKKIKDGAYGGVLVAREAAAPIKVDKKKDATAKKPEPPKPPLWKAEMTGWPCQVIAANGRVFVSTREGRIHAFGARKAKQHGIIKQAVAAEPFKEDAELAEAADTILKETKLTQGYAVVLDSTSGRLAHELAKASQLRVVAVFDDEKQAKAARKRYHATGQHVGRVLAWYRKPPATGSGQAVSRLPFPRYFADLIVSEAAARDGKLPKDVAADIQRNLKPIRGIALFGGKETKEKALKRWADDTKLPGWKRTTEGGNWASYVRPRLPKAGGWLDAAGDAGNTMCSNDNVLKPPLGVIWVGPPFSDQHSRGMTPAILVDGVLVHQVTSLANPVGKTEGYDAYTGRKLWEIKQAMRMVAAPGGLFLLYPDRAFKLDVWTSDIGPVYERPHGGGFNNIKVTRDGSTLLLSSSGGSGKESWGCLQAIDPATGKERWRKGGPGAKQRFDMPHVVSDNRMYYIGQKYGGGKVVAKEAQALLKKRQSFLDKIPPKSSGQDYVRNYPVILTSGKNVDSFRGYDLQTGKLLFTKPFNRVNAGDGWTFTHTFGQRPGRTRSRGGRRRKSFWRKKNPPLTSVVAANNGVVLFFTGGRADMHWKMWLLNQYRLRAITAYDGKTGEFLWYRFANYRGRPAVTEDYVYAEPWAFHLRSGKPRTRIHPTTGEPAEWSFLRPDESHGVINASRHFVFGRNCGLGYFDSYTDQGTYTFIHNRVSEWVSTSSGGGVVINPPHAIACQCEVSMPFTLALGTVDTPLQISQFFSQTGPSTPVKHVYFDAGSRGDRRDKDGNLWLVRKRSTKATGFAYEIGVGRYPGGTDVRRASFYTPIENTDIPFVFASAIRGVKTLGIAIGNAKGRERAYRVRLGFAALPGDKVGQRVFDVSLNGKKVLTSFDIRKEAGAVDRAIWKEFMMKLGESLSIEFHAKSEKPSAAEMPLINAVQVLRDDVPVKKK